MSIRALQDYTYYSKYARYNKEAKRRETWNEAVTRVENMHLRRYPQVEEHIRWAFDLVREKKILGSQRALQFGGRPIEKHEARLYNCWASYCDRVKFFQECLYLLLCGGGTGFSVQKHHVDKLPKFFDDIGDKEKVFVVPDTIEGWADSLGVLLATYMPHPDFPDWEGYTVEFDYSQIRPEGSLLSSGAGKAPGPEPLKRSLNRIRLLLDRCVKKQNKLRPIDAYDIVMHASDAVLSGGIRRSATLCIFSLDDEEMTKAKTGDWFIKNPQRARSNNSALLLRDQTTKKEFLELVKCVQEFGEPGVIWAENKESLFNPCQPGWAKVLTPMGIRCLDDVKVGDKIWSKEGWTTILKKWSTGINPVFKYTTTAGVFYGTQEHKLVSNGKKVKAKDAKSIDIIPGYLNDNVVSYDNQVILDGVVLGNGDTNRVDNDLVVLYIEPKDGGYRDSEISHLILQHGLDIAHTYEVITNIKAGELPSVFMRSIPERYLKGNLKTVISFLRGLYTAKGSICDNRVVLKSVSKQIVEDVQTMLSSIGIRSYYTNNKPQAINLHNGKYTSVSYDLNITVDIDLFSSLIGFVQKYKNDKLSNVIKNKKQDAKYKTNYKIKHSEWVSNEETFDITVDNNSHTYWTQGCNVSNCVEINLYGYDEAGNSGWQPCNLSEINGKKIKCREDFALAARGAAIIGTLQAGYTNFPYLGETSKRIAQREALLGVSITGVMDNPDVILNTNTQKQTAQLVVQTNQWMAEMIGINQAARCTTLKPAGSTSCILGSASGIHPHHAKRYFRRVQANQLEPVLQYFKRINAHAIEKSVWSANNTDDVVTFCIEVPDGSKTKNDISAIELLNYVKKTRQHWIEYGTVEKRCTKPWLRHNISNTINIRPNEWDEAANYIYANRQWFAGISLLPQSGDLDYAQAPMCNVLTPREILKEYGDCCLMASGLIVDGMHAFDHNLWFACDTVLGLREPKKGDQQQQDWIRRVKQFADRYLDGDLKKTTYLMKHVSNWKRWVDLKREYKDVDYTQMIEETDETKPMETVACAGGACELVF